MTDPSPPVRIVDAAALVAGPVDREVPRGWTARPGFELPASPWDLGDRRWACVGLVSDPAVAHAAVTALTRGVALVVAIELAGELRRRFEEDLAHAGEVVEAPPGHVAGLHADHVALLDGLAAGNSLTTAASRAHLSRRTANRRLAEARKVLGASSTAEAVTRWSGWRSGRRMGAP